MYKKNKTRVGSLLINVLLVILFLLFLTGVSFSSDEAPQILITSIGQSPDARMINVLISRYQIEAAYEQLATPEMVKDYKMVIAVIGGSSKGLGAAGIDKEQELSRSKSLIKEVKELEVSLLVMHIGGEARRGALSDAFLDVVVPYADHLIIVDSGNTDGYFNKMSEEHKIPLQIVEKIADSGELVKEYIEENLD
jgi:hypothetical protein